MKRSAFVLALAVSATAAHASEDLLRHGPAYGSTVTCALLQKGGAVSDINGGSPDHFYLDDSTLAFSDAFCLLLPPHKKQKDAYIAACNSEKNGKTEEAVKIVRTASKATISFPDGTGTTLARCQ